MNQQHSFFQRFNVLWASCRRGGWLLCMGLLLLVLAFYAGDTAWAGSTNAPLGQTNPPASTLVSDDFNSCTLDGRWQFVDPLGDSTLDVNGEQAVITVPAGIAHDVWQGNMNAPRLLQTVNNTNFEAEVKFESAVTRRYQLQGLLALADANNLLRFNFQSDLDGTHLLIVSFTSGVPTILADELIDGGAPISMRVRRVGNSWTASYSYDNITWETKPSLTFTESLVLSQFGPFIGNAGPSPAFTGVIDYLFNTASPISPEDPVINTIPVNVVGNGRVDKSCGSPLTFRIDCGAGSQLAFCRLEW